MRLCRWLPLVSGTGAVAILLLGYPLPAVAIIALMVLCPVICLVLYAQGKDTEQKIAASVGGRDPKKTD